MTRVAALLLHRLIRMIDWTPLGVVALLTLGLATFTNVGARPGLGLFEAVVLLRLSAILIGATVGCFLVDPLAEGTGPVPTPRWLRQLLRAVLGAAAGSSVWGGVYAITLARVAPGTPLPLAGLATEAAVCVLLGLACTAVAVRRRPQRSAVLLGTAGLLGLLTVTVLPQGDGLSPWLMPGQRGWDAVHLGWLMAVPLPVILLAIANRDLR
jgi:hypothetical protein